MAYIKQAPIFPELLAHIYSCVVFFFPPFFGKYTKEELVVHMAILRASLVAQLIKNPPAIQETTVQFLGWEDPLEKG